MSSQPQPPAISYTLRRKTVGSLTEAKLKKLIAEAKRLSIRCQRRFDICGAGFLTASALYRGVTWTTDAPFRETASAIEHCRALSILGVEMEAAALYAFAQARRKSVICLAHITNTMARRDGDFEKGAAGGSEEALDMIDLVIQAWLSTRTSR